MNFSNRLIGFLTLFLILCGIYYGVYGMIARHLTMPEKNSTIFKLEQTVELCREELVNYAKENEKLRMQVRWDNFLAIMLDKDQKVRFDGLEKYLNNKSGLHQPFKEEFNDH